MPVATRGAVRHLSAVDLERLGFEVVLANTYHLSLKPGRTRSWRDLGGLHGFMDWSGQVLTDSGGYQIFSLEPKVDDDGATFRSTYDGSLVRFTPEHAVAVQEALGADIQMVLDVCPPLPSDEAVIRAAVERTAAWAARARAAHTRVEDQCLFGIVQGGVDVDLRAESAERTVALDFDGYAIGGLSVGESLDRDAPGPGGRAGPPARRPAPVPDGRGRPRRPARGHRPGHRPLRLRAAHPPRPSRHRAHRRRPAEPAQRPLRRRRRAPGRRRASATSAPGTRGPTCATCSRPTSPPGPAC